MQRKLIRLIDLKALDYVKTGDELRYTYKGRVFTATVGQCGHIVAAAHEKHRPHTTDDAKSYYLRPSKFTNDCVTVYWHDLEKSDAVRQECLTNPNGFERIVHVKSGRTLNELRDAYMREHVVGGRQRRHVAVADDVRSPEDIVGTIETKANGSSSSSSSGSNQQPSKRRREDAAAAAAADEEYMLVDYSVAENEEEAAREASKTGADVGTDVASLLADGNTTIATLRASGNGRAYKQIAEILQQKLAHRSRALRTLMHYVEKFQQDSSGAETEAAREAARMIGAFVDATVAAEESGESSGGSSSSAAAAASALDGMQSVAVAKPISATELDGLLSESLAGTYKQ